MNTQRFTTELADKPLTAEFTDLADQANGSVLLTYGETAILVTAVMSNRSANLSYFPLSVEFEEKFYAAGAILGSRFQRREGRPSDEAILSARIVDRTIRPLFNQRIRQDIQVVVSVLAVGDDDPDVLAVIGTSLALAVSDIPWRGPVGAVRIGRSRESGETMVNPTYTERAEGLLDFEVLACGKDGTINMIETAACEIAEADVIATLEAATQVHEVLETWQHEIVSAIGKAKQTEPELVVPATLERLLAEYRPRIDETLFSGRAGKGHLEELKATFVGECVAEAVESRVAEDAFEEAVDAALHAGALTEGRRPDGREFTAVRPLYAKAGGLSPALHGSGIFYRGGTHIFSALTLGGPDAAQLLDTIEDRDTKKRFLHHYNFPPFSVGETGRVGGFNRRMIGHGALAEKALAPVIPSQSDFPYTIRLVSETLASNGSSSMGSVCASTLALMDGGVPISRPVAGIASGVLIAGDQYQLLTDIQGPEDEHGDMDLKVAGTSEGITAMQMDVKVDGIPIAILRAALASAKAARLHILETLTEEIATPRADVSPRAPHIITLAIRPDQIGLVIGGGGKTITAIKEETGVEEITIEDDGLVFITGHNGSADRAAERIRTLTKLYEVGEETTATVVRLAEFGAFAKLDEQHDGLIHISEIAPFRIERVDDVLHVGDEVPVRVIKAEDGRIGLSLKAVDPEYAKRILDAAAKG